MTIVESAEAKIDKKEEIKLRQEKRVVDEINKRADLNKDRDQRTALMIWYGNIRYITYLETVRGSQIRS